MYTDSASSSAGETVALPASDGGTASGRESGARDGGPVVVKKERDEEDEKDQTLPWKSSDEDVLMPETVDGEKVFFFISPSLCGVRDVRMHILKMS